MTQSEIGSIVNALVNPLASALVEPLVNAIAERLTGRLGGESEDHVGDVHDAAGWLGCSVPTVERLTRAGKIPSYKVGRLRRYRRADLLGQMKKGGRNHGE